MPIESEPKVATDIIAFGGATGRSRAAVLNYNVPLPGHQTGRRLIEIRPILGEDADPNNPLWSSYAINSGLNLHDYLAMSQPQGAATWEYDETAAARLWLDRVRTARVPGDEIAKLEQAIAEKGGIQTYREAPSLDTPLSAYLLYALTKLTVTGDLEIPVAGAGGTAGGASGPIVPGGVISVGGGKPTLLLVEIYGISSFLGDFGLGRTVKTFTLLPGEEMKISVKTWRSEKTTEEAGSSIVDSFHTTAAEKFRSAVQAETTSRSTRATESQWHVEADVKASWGWGSASVKGGASGGTQASRDHFSKQLADTVSEHANEASASRELSVTSSSERTREAGEDSTTERTIRNVNLRRTLNFVFRELNQEFITKVHLQEIRVAFTNGQMNSYEEVPISGLRPLLLKVCGNEARASETAQIILKAIGTIFDVEDKPQQVLETFTLNETGTDWKRAEATVERDGNYPAPTDRMFYRFRRGPIGQGDGELPLGSNPRVEGVVMKEIPISMRTDSIVVEALLGQADGLDPYAMAAQGAEAEAKALANEREKAIQETLALINDPEARAKAYAAIYAPARPNGAMPPVA